MSTRESMGMVIMVSMVVYPIELIEIEERK